MNNSNKSKYSNNYCNMSNYSNKNNFSNNNYYILIIVIVIEFEKIVN